MRTKKRFSAAKSIFVIFITLLLVGTKWSLRPDFPPVTADLIVPTFTRNVKVGEPPENRESNYEIALSL
jgi:hypothetical protein